VAGQDLPAARVVVVGNGTPLPELPPGVAGVELEENLGVSGGPQGAFGDVIDVNQVPQPGGRRR
jgi:hypothetical protein